MKVIKMDKQEPQLEDFIKYVEELVYKYGVELDVYAWARVKENILTKEQREMYSVIVKPSSLEDFVNIEPGQIVEFDYDKVNKNKLDRFLSYVGMYVLYVTSIVHIIHTYIGIKSNNYPMILISIIFLCIGLNGIRMFNNLLKIEEIKT
jgi:hypothetical protein